MSLFSRSLDELPYPLSQTKPEPGPCTVEIVVGRGQKQQIDGTGIDTGSFRLLVDKRLDFAGTRDSISAWWQELPPLLRRDQLDIITVPKIEDKSGRRVGGKAMLGRRFALLANDGKQELFHYIFLHEMAHLILDYSSIGRALASASVESAWRDIAKRDRLEHVGFDEAGISFFRLFLDVEEDTGDTVTAGAWVDIALGSDTITSYSESVSARKSWIEDMAESLALYLLSEATGGLNVGVAVLADGSLTRANFQENGEQIRCPFERFFPHRAEVLKTLCAWTPKEGKRNSWLAALKPVVDEGKKLRRESKKLRRRGLALPAVSPWVASTERPFDYQQD